MMKPGEASRQGEQTLAGSVNRLTAAGYTDWFKAEAGGLRAMTAGCLHSAESMRVTEVLRFEGETDPDDEAILFALECPQHGVKGTYSSPYGAGTPPLDMEMIRRLRRKPSAAAT
jgi:hypothetical protein